MSIRNFLNHQISYHNMNNSSNDSVSIESFLIENDNIILSHEECIKGMNFAVFKHMSEENTLFYQLSSDGYIKTNYSFSEVYADGNKTVGIRRSDGKEVMIDDFGVHEDY